VRDLRNYGVHCDRSVGSGRATRGDRRRHAQDFVADGRPTPGYTTLLVEATIEPGVSVARHTHPGVESAYVMEGGFELPIQGQATRMIKKGDGFQIPPETPHAGGKPGDAKTVILITYVVEKGKPLASPA
jgi:quercetin dioxygenase-like cupin family protein